MRGIVVIHYQSLSHQSVLLSRLISRAELKPDGGKLNPKSALARNWPFGSVLSMLLMAVVLAALIIFDV